MRAHTQCPRHGQGSAVRGTAAQVLAGPSGSPLLLSPGAPTVAGIYGPALRCNVPIWPFGAAADASLVILELPPPAAAAAMPAYDVAVPAVAGGGAWRVLWQRACLTSECGYLPATATGAGTEDRGGALDLLWLERV